MNSTTRYTVYQECNKVHHISRVQQGTPHIESATRALSRMNNLFHVMLNVDTCVYRQIFGKGISSHDLKIILCLGRILHEPLPKLGYFGQFNARI